MKRILSIIAVFFSTIIFAQTTVTGTVSDDNNDPIPGANIVLDAMNGTVADFDGNFTIVVNQNPPFTLTVSSVGFDSATINVTSESLNFDVQLVTSQNLLDEIVVNASRVPERLFESTVTVEKFDFKDIAQSTGPDFYSSLQGLKGVQINQGGLLLQQVNTRGFSTVYNEGFVQLVDGMNNEAPGLSFSAGNLLGIHELDIQSVELMPGAASALYGANAIKGILFMNSKNPFDFPGVSVAYKHGVTSQKAAGEKSDNIGAVEDQDANELRRYTVQGHMYMFEYKAKMKHLPYFDKFPLVYVLKSSKNEFWGLNLHYLKPKKRIQATKKLMQGRIDFPKKCFHKYLQPHVEGLLLDLAASEWDTAILLPTEDFVKEINGLSFSIKKEDVWKETDETFYDKIRGQRIVRGYGTTQSREMAT